MKSFEPGFVFLWAAGLAQAQGIPDPSARTGFHFGAQIQRGSMEFGTRGTFGDTFEAAGFGRSFAETEGTGFALRGGYDLARGPWLIGGGAEFSTGDLQGGLTGPFRDAALPSQADAEFSAGNIASIYLRSGYVSGPWLIYGAAGYTRADASISLDGTSFSPRLEGNMLAVGVDYQFGRNWSVYLEAARSDFGSVPGSDGMLDATLQQLKLGTDFRF